MQYIKLDICFKFESSSHPVLVMRWIVRLSVSLPQEPFLTESGSIVDAVSGKAFVYSHKKLSFFSKAEPSRKMTAFYDSASDSAVDEAFQENFWYPVCTNSKDEAMLGSNPSAGIDDRNMEQCNSLLFF